MYACTLKVMISGRSLIAPYRDIPKVRACNSEIKPIAWPQLASFPDLFVHVQPYTLKRSGSVGMRLAEAYTTSE